MPPDDPPELRAATRILNERIGFTPRQTLELGLASLCAGTDRTVVARPDSMGR
jgi:hypothetical protein